jgi:CRP/FNR family cyclic AMP-dependent transcriptional regulator
MTSAEQLTAFSVFDRLTAAQRGTVAASGQEVSFVAGTRLFDEGNLASGCWLIRSGQVALETGVPARGQVVVQTLGPGDVLGWSWLVPPHRWQFTAIANGPVSAIWLDTVRLRALAEEDKELGYPLALGLFEGLLARLQSTRARLLDLYGSPRER